VGERLPGLGHDLAYEGPGHARRDPEGGGIQLGKDGIDPGEAAKSFPEFGFHGHHQ
jgi:hypothetical protein